MDKHHIEKIISPANAYIKEILTYKTTKGQRESGKFFAEGLNVIEEAKKTPYLDQILCTEKYWDHFDSYRNKILISDRVARKLSDTNDYQEVFGVFSMVINQINFNHDILILDDIQDPGNMGTLLRSAYAFGFKTVIASNNSVSFYNPKVIRSAQGNSFHLNLINADLTKMYPKLQDSGYHLIGTLLHEDSVDLNHFMSDRKVAVTLGNEGHGINPDYDVYFETNINIQVAPELESLNVAVAGSIIMYEMFLK